MLSWVDLGAQLSWPRGSVELTSGPGLILCYEINKALYSWTKISTACMSVDKVNWYIFMMLLKGDNCLQLLEYFLSLSLSV